MLDLGEYSSHEFKLSRRSWVFLFQLRYCATVQCSRSHHEGIQSLWCQRRWKYRPVWVCSCCPRPELDHCWWRRELCKFHLVFSLYKHAHSNSCCLGDNKLIHWFPLLTCMVWMHCPSSSIVSLVHTYAPACGASTNENTYPTCLTTGNGNNKLYGVQRTGPKIPSAVDDYLHSRTEV